MKRKVDGMDEEEEREKIKKQKKAGKKDKTEKGPSEKGDNLKPIGSPPTSPKKKKKKKSDKEKLKAKKEKKKKKKPTSESSQEENGSTSQTTDTAPKKRRHTDAKSLTDWSVEDYEALLHNLENLTPQGGELVYNKIPGDLWAGVSVGDHSPETCQAAWIKICQVVRNRMTLEHMLNVIKDMLGSPKHQKIMSILVGKKNLFPGAPQTHLVNNYQLYTRRRLAETPKPSFKDIGHAWKSLSEAEKKHYQEEAEKINKKVKKEMEAYLESLSPEMKERYLEQQKPKSAAGKKNMFPGAPQTHMVNSYQLYTRRRLAETPQPSFKDVGHGWKSLSEAEKKDYQEEAEKINKKVKKEMEAYLESLSPEMKERYLEHQKPKSSHAQKPKKEFADAPKTSHTNSYNVYTRERLTEKPSPSFKEIASCWKSMSETERKPYQTQAAQINAEAKKALEKYVQSLSEDQRKKFLKKTEKQTKTTPQPKKRVLGLRDLKKAEVQYLMEEREGALQENPGVEDEEVLQRLSEAFRAMSYEDQKTYLQKANESASEQKKITEFYKHFESPVVKAKKNQAGKLKLKKKSQSKKIVGSSSDVSSEDSSSDDEITKKPPVKSLTSSPSKKAINAKSPVKPSPIKKTPVNHSSNKSDSSSSSDEDEEESARRKKKRSPQKKTPTKVRDSSDSSSSDEEETAKKKSPAKTLPLKKTQLKHKKRSSSSDSSSSSEEEETAKRKMSPVKLSPQKKTPMKKESSTSDTSSSSEEEKTTKGKMSPVIPVSPQKKSLSTPVKPVPKKGSSSDSTSSSDEEKTAKGRMSPVFPVTPSSPKKAVKRPAPKSSSSSSSSSSDSDDFVCSSQKAPHPPKMSLSQRKSINTPSSLKAHKKKQK